MTAVAGEGPVAGRDGTAVLQDAHRHDPLVADLCDTIMRTQGVGLVSALLGLGGPFETAPEPGVEALVVALDAPVEVTTEGAHGPLTVEPAEARAVANLRRVDAAAGAAWLAFDLRRVGADTVLEAAAATAGWSPLLRVDLPYDLDAPAELYGHGVVDDVVDLMCAEAQRLLGDDALDLAEARWALQWRSLAATGPRVPPVRLPVERWPRGIVARGRLVGSVGQPVGVTPTEEFVPVAAGGWQFAVHDHAVVLLDAVIADRRTALDEVATDCPHGDPDCARRGLLRLSELGLVDLELPEPENVH